MLEHHLADFASADRPSNREGREMVQAFVGRHRAFFILLGVLVAQLLLLSLQITRNQKVRLIQVWAVALLDPFERTLGGATDYASSAWRTYRGLWAAQQQNQELRVQLVAARSRIGQLSMQAAEAERLRALLDLKGHLPYQTVAADVIARGPGLGSGSVFINQGADAGLATDLAVMTPEGVVGKILEVFPHSAQVLLITDPSSGLGCMLERSRVQGILKGASRDLCQVLYVMNEEAVEKGEGVVTSGLDQIYPKGLPIGKIIATDDGNIYKKIVVKPAARLDRLESVLVVVKPPSPDVQALTQSSRR